MSQDPNSYYGNNPQNPYGAPQNPYGGQQPYSAPQNPYGPPQNPYGPPQDPYGAQQNPYGPPQNPYAQPQNPYGVPPQGGVYGIPAYGPGPIAFAPLPLNEAVRLLPKQYIKALTKPAAATFAEELSKAGWDITWVQLLIYVVIRVVLGLLTALIVGAVVRSSLASSASAYASTLSLFTTASSTGGALLSIITVPLGFFAMVGLQYLLAKAFGGQGSFLGQSYTNLLYTVPLAVISGVAAVLFTAIPAVGSVLNGIVGLAVLVYTVILNIFQIMASHRLSGGKATGVVLLSWLIVFLVVFLCVVTVVAIIFSALHLTTPR